MKFSEALAAIRALENGSELVSAIEGEVETLKNKNFEVIGEKRGATSKAQTLETALTAIAKAAGVEGDLEAVLTGLEPKIRAIASEATQLKADKTALETRATEAEGKVSAFERQGKIAEIATKAGANAKALEKLLGDKLSEIAIAEDGSVKIGDKTLKDYVSSDETLKDFAPALFPSASPSPSPSPAPKQSLPSGSPKSSDGKGRKDLLSTYSDRTYSGAKVLSKKAEEADD